MPKPLAEKVLTYGDIGCKQGLMRYRIPQSQKLCSPMHVQD